jgi:hypothetical protein
VLEAFRQRAHRHRELAVGRIGDAARRRGVMRLVKDQHSARSEIPEQLDETCRICNSRPISIGLTKRRTEAQNGARPETAEAGTCGPMRTA